MGKMSQNTAKINVTDIDLEFCKIQTYYSMEKNKIGEYLTKYQDNIDTSTYCTIVGIEHKLYKEVQNCELNLEHTKIVKLKTWNMEEGKDNGKRPHLCSIKKKGEKSKIEENQEKPVAERYYEVDNLFFQNKGRIKNNLTKSLN